MKSHRHKFQSNDRNYCFKIQKENNIRNRRFSDEKTSDEFEEKMVVCSKKGNNYLDFRKKFKTEICKFWSINEKCKFGKKVVI